MTSTTSNSNFGAAFKKLLRRRWAGAVIILVLSIVVGIVAATMSLSSYKYIYDYDTAYAASTVERINADIEIGGVGGILCIIIGIYDLFACSRYFKEIYKKRSCDYYFASPITRSEYFNSAFLFGAAVNAAAFCAGIGVFYLIMKIPSLPNVVFYFENSAFAGVLAMLFALLAAFAMLMLCAAMAGRRLHFIILAVISLISAPLALTNISANINNVWGVIRNTVGYASFSPAGNAINAYIALSDTKRDAFLIAVSVAEIIGAYVIGLSLFKRRRAEVAEVSLAGRIMPYVFLVLLQISAFMSSGGVDLFAMAIIIGLISALIVTLIFSAIFYKKAFTKETLLSLGCASLASIIFLSAVYLPNHTPFIDYIPEASQVESVEFNCDSYTYSEYQTALSLLFGYIDEEAESSFVITSEEGIENTIALHKKLISDDVIRESKKNLNGAFELEAYDDFVSDYYATYGFEIKYNLKGGKSVARQYCLDPNLIESELGTLFQSEEIIRQTEPYNIDPSEIIFVGAQLFELQQEYDSEADEYYYYGGYYTAPEASDITANYAEFAELSISDKLNADTRSFLDNNYSWFQIDFGSWETGYSNERGEIDVYVFSETATPKLKEKVSQMDWQQFAEFIDSEAYYTNYYDQIDEYIISVYDEDVQSLDYLTSLGLTPVSSETYSYYE